MASSDAGPRTEAELLQRLPASNVPGAFPREILPPNERILFETRPRLFALYWGRSVWTFFWSGLALLALAVDPSNWEGSVGIIVLFGLPLWVSVPFWWKSAYALTDRRVLRVAGLRGSDFQEATYEQVQNLTTEPGISGGLRFDTSPPVGAFGHAPGWAAKQRPLRWQAIANAPRVYEFVQEAFALGLRQSAERGAVDAAWQKIDRVSVRCEYCGTLIDLATLDRSNLRCPSCSAPLSPT